VVARGKIAKVSKNAYALKMYLGKATVPDSCVAHISGAGAGGAGGICHAILASS